MRKVVLVVVCLLLIAVAGAAVYMFVHKVPAPNTGNSDALKEQIVLDSPTIGSTVSSPLTVTGRARGNWYFEATFPVRIVDANGVVLGSTTAQAQSDWTTTDFVSFTANLNFTAPTTSTGTLVLQKDNPSGLPENEAELDIPVTFNMNTRAVKLYYYSVDKDKDASGNPRCSKDGLVAVQRQIPITQTPIQDTIRLLIQGDLTQDDRDAGLSTEYPLPGFELVGANLKDKNLTLEFKDPQNKTTGGSCRVSILWDQIEATALQFPEVSTVSFKPEELFQP